MNTLYASALLAGIWLSTVGGAFFYGQGIGQAREIAKRSEIQDAIRGTRDAAMQAAADAISSIKITNTTIRGEVQREIRTNTVYRDCRLPPDGVRIANDALRGQPTQRAGDSQLPRAPGIPER